MSTIDNKALKEKIEETIESITAIKGAPFAKLVGYMVSATHLSHMIAVSVDHLDDRQRYVVKHQLSATLALGTTLISEANGFGEAEIKEILDWTNTITQHIEDTINQKGE